MSTLGEMRTEVLAYGFDASVYSSRVNRWLNDAQSEICRSIEIPELLVNSTISVLPLVASYTKPSDLVRVRALVDVANNNQLSVADYEDLLVNNGATANLNTGRSCEYALGVDILLSPVPETAYTLTFLYYKDPPTLSSDGDVSLITPDWHKAMIRYAVAEAYMAEDDQQMHAYHFQRFQQALLGLGSDRMGENDDSPERVKGTWG